MPRMPRVVVPGLPHHITQRGVRSMPLFFTEEDRAYYYAVLRQYGATYGIEFLSQCLMTNHVHLVAIPQTEDSLAKALGSAHQMYARRINDDQDVRGHLFQSRFFSCVLDEAHLLAAVRYVETNPVRAGLATQAADYPWSSARFHLGLSRMDPLVSDASLCGLVTDWSTFLQHREEECRRIRRHTRIGRPCGSDAFLRTIEAITGRRMWRPKRRRTAPAGVCVSAPE